MQIHGHNLLYNLDRLEQMGALIWFIIYHGNVRYKFKFTLGCH